MRTRESGGVKLGKTEKVWRGIREGGRDGSTGKDRGNSGDFEITAKNEWGFGVAPVENWGELVRIELATCTVTQCFHKQ